MNTIRRLLIIAAVLYYTAGLPSGARETDGTLGLLRSPNNGMPVITTVTPSFDATLTEQATLSLTREGISTKLATTWTPLPNGLFLAQCTTPEALLPGTYALNAETEHQKDSNNRSVYVMESMPETYVIAHITDVHIGTTRHPRKDTAIIGDVIASLNASNAALALFTGDLTENGEYEQFQNFLALLDTCRMPTFVMSGNHDRQARHYEQFFGVQTYAFRFGKDGYLVFDTKDYLIADELGEQDGLLHYYRRQIRDARWSIGLTHRYDLTMGIRAQLTLFVDDPLDYLLYGHYHREAGEQDGIPWGNTEIIMTPAAINGQYRLIGVDEQGLHPQETIQASSPTSLPEGIPISDNTPPNPAQ
jgi:predicted phosphodiesterase